MRADLRWLWRGTGLAMRRTSVWLAIALLVSVGHGPALAARPDTPPPLVPPLPKPAHQVPPANAAAASRISPELAETQRLVRINAAKSWGYQLNGIKLEELQRAPSSSGVSPGIS